MPHTGIQIAIRDLDVQFKPGFPRIKALLHTEGAGASLDLVAWAALEHVVKADSVTLRLHFIGIEPQIGMPELLKTFISDRAASWLSGAVKPISVPLQSTYTFAPETRPIDDFWVPTANGRVLLHADLPQPPPITLQWTPGAVFFDRDGLHVAGRVAAGAPAAPLPAVEPKQSDALSDSDLDALLSKWRMPAGKDYAVHIPSEPVLKVLAGLTGLSEAQRTVTVRGVNQEGHVMEKTGGAPFGNGFRAWLDGPERLTVRAVLSNFRPEWREGHGIAVTTHLAANGNVQVHVHGNAPHFQPKIFGKKIGGGIKVGGGAGTSVGASASGATDMTAGLTYEAGQRAFVLKLEGPNQLRCNVDIGGVPDDLEKWLKAGFNVPLPAGKELYRFTIPPVISERVEVNLPDGATPEKRSIAVSSSAPQLAFTSTALEISGTLEVNVDGEQEATK